MTAFDALTAACLAHEADPTPATWAALLAADDAAKAAFDADGVAS